MRRSKMRRFPLPMVPKAKSLMIKRTPKMGAKGRSKRPSTTPMRTTVTQKMEKTTKLIKAMRTKKWMTKRNNETLRRVSPNQECVR